MITDLFNKIIEANSELLKSKGYVVFIGDVAEALPLDTFKNILILSFEDHHPYLSLEKNYLYKKESHTFNTRINTMYKFRIGFRTLHTNYDGFEDAVSLQATSFTYDYIPEILAGPLSHSQVKNTSASNLLQTNIKQSFTFFLDFTTSYDIVSQDIPAVSEILANYTNNGITGEIIAKRRD